MSADPPAASAITTLADLERAKAEIAAIQEIYDAATLLFATLGFTHTAEDLLTPELDYATRRLIAARSAVRHLHLVKHVDAGLLEKRELPSPFNVPSAIVQRHIRATEILQ